MQNIFWFYAVLWFAPYATGRIGSVQDICPKCYLLVEQSSDFESQRLSVQTYLAIFPIAGCNCVTLLFLFFAGIKFREREINW